MGADGKVSLIVQPFETLSETDEQRYFADGLTEDLLTDLSNVVDLKVATRNASQALQAGQISVDELSTGHGIEHVLQGLVRRNDNMVRVNAQLIHIKSQETPWSERFSGDGHSIFEIQDKLCKQIVNALSLHLADQNIDRGTRNPHAYDKCLRGRSEYYRYSPPNMAAALAFFEEAATLDPCYAEAYAYQSYCRTALHVFAWPGSDSTLKPALELAERAVSLAPQSAIANARMGWVLGYLNQPDHAISVFAKAVALDEKNAEVLFAYGETLNRLGRPDQALNILKQAFSIESFVPPSWEFALGHSYVLQKNYDEALDRLLAVIDRVPDFIPARVQLARLYSEVGRIKTAPTPFSRSDALRLDTAWTMPSVCFPIHKLKSEYVL